MDKNIYHIASDYFGGRISESDLNFLQSWLTQSPDNKMLLDELEQIWKMTGELNFNLTPDVEAEWNKFIKKRNKPGNDNIFKIDKQIKFRKFLKIAAVVIPALLVLSIGFFYLKNKSKTTEWVTINTTNEKKECLLFDGTKVWVNRHSTFIYPNKFSKDERVVKLEGEAFFEVVKGNAPFTIGTEKTRIIVIGTAFNVRAYQKEKNTEVIVSKGKVMFEEKSQHLQKAILLPGDKGIYNESTEKISRETVTDYNLLGWKDDRLSFRNTSLNEIQSIITRYFDIHVQVSPSMGQCKFTGDFKKPALNEMLDVISVSLGASYQVKNDTVFLKGQGCKN